MRKYGKWVLTLGLLTAAPGMTLAAGTASKGDGKPAADEKSAAKTDNQRVAEDIAKALRSKRVQGDIGIEFKGGVAILSGSVVDPKMKEKAGEAAKRVRNVAKVDNRLTVAAAEKPRQAMPQPTAVAPSPRGPVTQASHTAAPGGGVVSANHTTSASGGVVSANHTVSAAAPSRVQQVHAEVPAGGISNNQEVAEQIGAALTAANLDGYDIEIRYQNGVALLSGSVGTQTEKDTATQVVSTIPGVRSVANRLTCGQSPAMAMGGPQGQRMMPGQMPPGYGPMPGQMTGQMPAGYGPMPGAGPMAGQMPPGYGPMPGQGQMPPGQPPMPGQPAMYPASYRQGDPAMAQPGMGAMPMAPSAPMPPTYGHPGMGASQAVYNQPSVPEWAWPSYSQYPNSATVSYPQQYSASAWPYIGPFYPYPQVPLGWRDATLRWDDGQWNLMFRTRTDKWWWYFNPNNW